MGSSVEASRREMAMDVSNRVDHLDRQCHGSMGRQAIDVVHAEADALEVKRGNRAREALGFLHHQREVVVLRQRADDVDQIVDAAFCGESVFRSHSDHNCRMRRADLDNPSRPLVCVDLNGVLDAYTGWKDPDHWDPPRAGARAFLESLHAHGFDVVVFTTRHPTGVRRWLREHHLHDLVLAVTRRKPPAHVFIDDRAICFQGDFDQALKQVIGFKAHWEP
jgi:hypothetical protein